MMISSQAFILYANCVPVKGAKRSAIYDLQKGIIFLIPNDLFDFLQKNESCKLEDTINFYGVENAEVIEEYVKFLLDKELGFITDSKNIERFPKINFDYNTPYEITNVIIDIAEEEHNFANLISQICELGCVHLELRVFSEKPQTYISQIFENLKGKRIQSVAIFIKYSTWVSETAMLDLYYAHEVIESIVVHSSPKDYKMTDEDFPLLSVSFSRDCIGDEQHCGFVHPDFFSVNIKTFSESSAFNSCLNKKLSIDKAGFIKNCPAMSKSFGHHRDTPLAAAVAHAEFKQVWAINKEQIEVCKVCEFRYACIDCRAITKDTTSAFSKPLRCRYDPYTCTWA